MIRNNEIICIYLLIIFSVFAFVPPYYAKIIISYGEDFYNPSDD